MPSRRLRNWPTEYLQKARLLAHTTTTVRGRKLEISAPQDFRRVEAQLSQSVHEWRDREPDSSSLSSCPWRVCSDEPAPPAAAQPQTSHSHATTSRIARASPLPNIDLNAYCSWLGVPAPDGVPRSMVDTPETTTDTIAPSPLSTPCSPGAATLVNPPVPLPGPSPHGLDAKLKDYDASPRSFDSPRAIRRVRGYEDNLREISDGDGSVGYDVQPAGLFSAGSWNGRGGTEDENAGSDELGELVEVGGLRGLSEAERRMRILVENGDV
ncbi:hypothetical protein AX16_001251 [Volvariella volvacea WC 439]|nr:hypothetical protein AX16_001251 [Volvariella volvacea WC 439]